MWLRGSRHTNTNKLTLNVVVFGTRHKLSHTPTINLEIDGKQIEYVQTVEYLGLLLADKSTFENHVGYIHSEAVKN